MKMRARMVDGTPVTFESIDRGGVTYRERRTGHETYGAPYVTEFVGEGFHVWSQWHGQPVRYERHDAIGYPRSAFDRWSLEQNGVDTATVEYWDSSMWDQDKGIDAWVRLWPPKIEDKVWEIGWGKPGIGLRREEAVHRGFGPFEVKGSLPPEPGIKPIYCGEDYLITEAMTAAGCAALQDVLVLHGAMYEGKVFLREPAKAAARIWRAMEAHRVRHR